jgi:hypothetical protein
MTMSQNLMLTFPQDVKEVSSKQKVKLGTLRVSSDGRKFRYAKAGASALAAGHLSMALAGIANHVGLTGSVYPVGTTLLSVTVGATAVADGEYADGYLQINAGTGLGTSYRILSHGACNASGVLTLTLASPLLVALDTTSKLSLLHNPWYGLAETATADGSVPVGVPLVAIPAGYFGWVQTGGEGCALIKGTPAVGSMLCAGTVAAGSVAAMSTTLDVLAAIVGTKIGVVGVDGEYGSVQLAID